MVGVLGPDSDNDNDTYPLAWLSTQIGTSGQFEVVIDFDASIDTDKLLLAVSDSVANLPDHRLDGQWQDAASTHPPGNESTTKVIVVSGSMPYPVTSPRTVPSQALASAPCLAP